MKAIVTKYLGPTNSRGSRIKASAEGVKSITISYDHALNIDDLYRKAAQALADKYQWKGKLVAGQLPDGRCVFCFVF